MDKTDKDRFAAVDEYLERAVVAPDEGLSNAAAATAAAGLPSIAVTPLLGKGLYLLALMVNARRVLEIGTLGGYSAIWLGRAVTKVAGDAGRVTTIEADPKHAAVARKNIANASLASVVTVVEGRASDVLPRVQKDADVPFDLVFIDADKASITDYFEWAIRLSRPGAVIVVDNVVREGKVTDATSDDVNVRGVRAFFDRFGKDLRVEMTAAQVVGAKGWDGVAIAVVLRQ